MQYYMDPVEKTNIRVQYLLWYLNVSDEFVVNVDI